MLDLMHLSTILLALGASACNATAAAHSTFSNLAKNTVIQGDYNGPLRPQVHFSPPTGFMNDPNGLFKADDGTYHLYYQYNPTGLTAGNQHWGHATSTDLYHWENQPIAISPKDSSEGIFSGSAVIDRNNTSGFFPNQKDGVVAIYTLNTPTSETQYIAYSLDGGYTFNEYEGNPVIDIDSTQFRDPKVFWHEPTSKWVVAVAYAQEYVIGLWTSSNLREWTHASNFSHAGLLGLQYECPSLVQIPMLKNGSSTSIEALLSPDNFVPEPMWLMFVSINPGAPLGGSISQFFPGNFNGTHFEAIDGAARVSDFAKDNYAGQFFAEIPGNMPQLSIDWASNWQYCNDVPTDTEGFRSSMTVPRLHVLANTTRTPYGLLSIPYPMDSIKTSSPLLQTNSLANKSTSLSYRKAAPSGALSFNMTARNLPSSSTGSMNFTLQCSSTGETLSGGVFLSPDSMVFLDRGNTHGFKNIFFNDRFFVDHPLDAETQQFSLQVIVDNSVIEMFVDGGIRSGTATFFPEGELDTLVLGSSGVNDGVSVEAVVWGLESTWKSNSNATGDGNSSQTVEQNLDGECLYQ